MTETGGQGLGNSKGGKSAHKSSGKDNGSAKSKGGRKVQFEPEGSGGKVRKGDNIANGSKSSQAKAPSTLECRLEKELPENSKFLMDCEAAEILQGIQEQMVMLSEDPNIKLPVSFDSGLMYAKRGSYCTKSLTVGKILQPLKKYGVSDAEICQIANLRAESVEEVFALIPSLKAKENKIKEPLRIALGELTNLRDALDELAKFNESVAMD
ncbi:unnamed protein product [Fraxinus pennsylvanica]|uniref:RNA polymerase Rpb4/RPC9 core domain-containing protein n=1 Tax=Fraxinus pennsylvanica TaxID=56036 RepID=A0AAD1Z033_9LAMI|nr:unnamed protein product [Fraxinus pennsylvanica]